MLEESATLALHEGLRYADAIKASDEALKVRNRDAAVSRVVLQGCHVAPPSAAAESSFIAKRANMTVISYREGGSMTYPDPKYVGGGGEASATFRPAGHAPEVTYASGNTAHYLATGASTDGLFGLYR